jgi:hypothetical protein
LPLMTVDRWPTNDQSHEWDVSAKSFNLGMNGVGSHDIDVIARHRRHRKG